MVWLVNPMGPGPYTCLSSREEDSNREKRGRQNVTISIEKGDLNPPPPTQTFGSNHGQYPSVPIGKLQEKVYSPPDPPTGSYPLMYSSAEEIADIGCSWMFQVRPTRQKTDWDQDSDISGPCSTRHETTWTHLQAQGKK